MMIQSRSVEQTTLPLFEEELALLKSDSTSTFADNLSLPVHRWFRYSAGFSANWVRQIIEREKDKGRTRVLDPFSGSGTVLLEGDFCGVETIGIEAHPFVARLAKAKLNWQEDPKAFREYALSVLENAKDHPKDVVDPPPLIKKCFPPEILTSLESLRKSWEVSANGSPLSELTWLTLASILRQCSPVGTAQWQYILPSKTKAKITDPYKAFEAKIHLIYEDMRKCQSQSHKTLASVFWSDAREYHQQIPKNWADLIITSPPYANNYDYADATRLEMTFFGDIQGWGDLQDAVRKYLVRSCTQHVSSITKETYTITADPLLRPIQHELAEVCKLLEAEKENHGGKKQYHTMIATYFSDLAKVWTVLRHIAKEGSLACFVIGDSAPYGIYVPVDRWLGELAIAAGFKSYSFEKTRDRNIKWKNRKHSVPLQEGRLWIEG
jgi:hypothetical protein